MAGPMPPERAMGGQLAAPQANLGLDTEVRRVVVEHLNRLLADELVLYVKTRNYHWNVIGPDFPGLHKLFEEQYEALGEVLDEVAERARAIGGWARASLAGCLERTRLEERPNVEMGALDMVQDLLVTHEAVVRHLREVRDVADEGRDVGTVNLLEDLVARHEKMAWMLAATHARPSGAR